MKWKSSENGERETNGNLITNETKWTHSIN